MADIERLYKEHYGFIFRFLLSMCHDQNLAEELAQETFFRAYINIKSLRADSKAAIWLCQIAKNLYFAWCKEHKKLLPLEDYAQQLETADVAEMTAIKLLSDQAMKCLADLEEPYQDVLKLYVFGGVSLKGISQLYGKSESWARVTFYRAKQKIVERMK